MTDTQGLQETIHMLKELGMNLEFVDRHELARIWGLDPHTVKRALKREAARGQAEKPAGKPESAPSQMC